MLRHAACTGATVYRRDFENGSVLVNPGAADAECRLDAEHYDVSGEPRKVAAITVKARDAAFLWRIR